MENKSITNHNISGEERDRNLEGKKQISEEINKFQNKTCRFGL